MSFSDAIGQIDQIVQWEQQLADPAALTQTTSTGGNSATDDTSGTGATDTSTNSTFAQTLAQAQAEDATTAATATDPTDATAAVTPTATATSILDPTATSASDLLSGGDSQLMASLSGLSSSSADEAAGATTSTDPTDEASALESALSSTGTTGSPALIEGESGASGGTATSPADPRIDAMTEEANALVGKPYVWGGGHDGWGPQSGYDCSGFVSAVLHAGGYLSTPQDTTTLPTSADMESGPGQYVTVYDRDKPGQQGHVIIDIAGQFYESGGQSGSWGGGGGVEQIATPSAKYLSTFDTILHPAGL
jgi:cell wall-associated NlpC family hydrolase